MQPRNLLSNCLTPQQLESYARGVLQGQAALDCEEHLDSCSHCQDVLATLFEAGNRPAWLSSRSRINHDHVTRTAPNDNSTLRSSESKPGSAPRRSGALRLWQQQLADQIQPQTPSPCGPETPKSIGRYRIEGVLGSGGFGHVYLARDEKLKRHVALKVPHQAQASSGVSWDIMLAEAQTVAALDHPAIVPIYDVASTDEVPMFLVSKLIEGQTLAEHLLEHVYSPLEAAQLIARVADALQYAHEQGVVHRDIKPQNILLDLSGQVYLSDFGLAWRLADDARAFPNAGTPYYMSPEHLSGQSQTIDERSDVYSLGKVLQQLLAASSDLLAICQRATAADPALRYQSAAEFAAALRSFIHFQTPLLKRHRRLILTIATASAVCMMISLLSWFSQSRTMERKSAEQAVEAFLRSAPGNLSLNAESPLLRSTWAQPQLQNAALSSDRDKRLRANLLLMRHNSDLVTDVAEDMLNSPVDLASGIAPLLLPYAERLTPSMWQTLQQAPQASRRLNAAAFLSIAAEHDERWQNHSLIDKLLEDLIRDSLADRKARLACLVKQRSAILAAVHRAWDTKQYHLGPEDHLNFNSIWELLVQDDLPSSIDLMLCGPPTTYSNILGRLDANDPETIQYLRDRLCAVATQMPPVGPVLRQRHLAGMALLKLGHADDYWPLWCSQSDPTHLAIQISVVGYEPLTANRIISHLRETGGLKPVESLPDELGQRLFSPSLSQRRNLLLALTASQLKASTELDPQFLAELKGLFVHDADPCVHGLAKQLLIKASSDLPELDLSTRSVKHDRAWFVDSLGEAMVSIPRSPATPYRYAIASREVQCGHFQQFLLESTHAWQGAPLGDADGSATAEQHCAQVGMSWYDAAAYCNWLSRREGLDECYTRNGDGKFEEGMTIKPNAIELNGYRLPTPVEWENAGRAGAVSSLYFGDSTFMLREYLWDMTTARGTTWPVGLLRPNSLGLFDVHGNASEWTMPDAVSSESTSSQLCQVVTNDLEFEHRGGHVMGSQLPDFFFGSRPRLHPDDRRLPTGLRVVRTLK